VIPINPSIATPYFKKQAVVANPHARKVMNPTIAEDIATLGEARQMLFSMPVQEQQAVNQAMETIKAAFRAYPPNTASLALALLGCEAAAEVWEPGK
jgi:hypothetical protein